MVSLAFNNLMTQLLNLLSGVLNLARDNIEFAESMSWYDPNC